MLIFYDIVLGETIELENANIQFIEYGQEAIIIEDVQGNRYSTKRIECQ